MGPELIVRGETMPSTRSRTPLAYLDKAIARYSPEVAATARAGLKKLRARFPGARLLVYERRQSLPIGFAPSERGPAVFSQRRGLSRVGRERVTALDIA